MKKQYELIGGMQQKSLLATFSQMAGVTVKLYDSTDTARFRANLTIDESHGNATRVAALVRAHGCEMRLRLCSLPLL